MIELALLIWLLAGLILSLPLGYVHVDRTLDRRRHQRVLEHTAELELEIAWIDFVPVWAGVYWRWKTARDFNWEKTARLGWASSSAPLAAADLRRTIAKIREAPDRFRPKRVDRESAPIMDDAYFEAKRWQIPDDQLERYLERKRTGKDVSEYEVDRTPAYQPRHGASYYAFGGASHYPRLRAVPLPYGATGGYTASGYYVEDWA